VASSVVGNCVDPATRLLAGAQVTLTNTSTGAVRQASTDSLGTYRFVELDPGPYSLTIKATGFKSETVNGIQVAMQETHYRQVGRFSRLVIWSGIDIRHRGRGPGTVGELR